MKSKFLFAVLMGIVLMLIPQGVALAEEPFFPAVYAIDDDGVNTIGILSNQPVKVNGVLIEVVKEHEGKNLYVLAPAESGEYVVTYGTSTDYNVQVVFLGSGEIYLDQETGIGWQAATEDWGRLGIVKYLTPIMPDGRVAYTVVGWGFSTTYPEGNWWIWDYDAYTWLENSQSWGYWNIASVLEPVPPPEEPDCSMDIPEPFAPFAYYYIGHNSLALNVIGLVNSELVSFSDELEEGREFYFYPISELGSYGLSCSYEGPAIEVEAFFITNGTAYEDEHIRIQAAQGSWADVGLTRYSSGPVHGSVVYGILGRGYDLEWPWPEGITWWDFSEQKWTAQQVWGYYSIIKVPSYETPEPPPDPDPPSDPDPEPPSDPDPEPDPEVYQIFIPAVLKNYPKEQECLKVLSPVGISVWTTSEGLGVCSDTKPEIEGYNFEAVKLPDDYGHAERYNWIFQELPPGEYTVNNGKQSVTVSIDWVTAGQTFHGRYISFQPRSGPIGVVEYLEASGNKYVYSVWGFDYDTTPKSWGYPLLYWNSSIWQLSQTQGEFNTIGIVPR
jgi:hypothetical protein